MSKFFGTIRSPGIWHVPEDDLLPFVDGELPTFITERLAEATQEIREALMRGDPDRYGELTRMAASFSYGAGFRAGLEIGASATISALAPPADKAGNISKHTRVLHAGRRHRRRR